MQREPLNRRAVLVGGAVVFVAALAVFLLQPPGPADDPGGDVEEASAGVAPPGAPGPKVPAERVDPSEAGARSGGAAAPAAQPAPVAAPTGAARPETSAPSAAAPGGSPESAAGPGQPGGAAPAESKATLAKEDIRAAIQELRGQIKECFEQGLKSKPDLDGTVKVEFVIVASPDGGSYAKEGEIDDSTLGAPLVEACILSKIQTAKFKDLQGDGQVRVRYPFRLRSDQAGGFGGP